MIIILEGLAMAFWLLLICVVGTANGPAGLVIFYEKDVRDRAVELGLTTPERIKKTALAAGLAMWIPLVTAVPAMVYGLNGASGFRDGFLQLAAVYMIMGLFDRLFIDWYWVGRTKAWRIPGTEDLMPYIPKRTLIKKWTGTLVGFPMLAAIVAGAMKLLGA